ncbi:MAG: hypothetical protein K8963_09775, partial [Proteobacteria bacterium]|nr:hypothetical protein [Pseudomonadota bacterium]
MPVPAPPAAAGAPVQPVQAPPQLPQGAGVHGAPVPLPVPAPPAAAVGAPILAPPNQPLQGAVGPPVPPQVAPQQVNIDGGVRLTINDVI